MLSFLLNFSLQNSGGRDMGVSISYMWTYVLYSG